MSATILVFDSGVGGLSIFSELQLSLPNANYYYLFDNARLPYGELDEQELISGCVSLISAAVAELSIDVVVVACNSASTLVLPSLREKLTVPIVGVVPAIKPAAQLSTSKHIGLLATPGTVNRSYTDDLICQFASDCKVERFGSSQLVLMAESKLAKEHIDQAELNRVLAPIKQSGIDTLVLGCTHFPILKGELQNYLGESVLLLDSAKAIAARVKVIVGEPATSEGDSVCHALFTTNKIGSGLEATLREWGFSSVNRFMTAY